MKSTRRPATTGSMRSFSRRMRTLFVPSLLTSPMVCRGVKGYITIAFSAIFGAGTEDVPSFKHTKKRGRERDRRKGNWRKRWRSIKSHLLSYKSKHQIHTNDKGRRTSPTQTRGGLNDNFFLSQSPKWHLQRRLSMLKVLFDVESPRSGAWIF